MDTDDYYYTRSTTECGTEPEALFPQIYFFLCLFIPLIVFNHLQCSSVKTETLVSLSFILSAWCSGKYYWTALCQIFYMLIERSSSCYTQFAW